MINMNKNIKDYLYSRFKPCVQTLSCLVWYPFRVLDTSENIEGAEERRKNFSLFRRVFYNKRLKRYYVLSFRFYRGYLLREIFRIRYKIIF